MKFKKVTALGVAAVLMAAGVAGCNGSGNQEQEGKINVSVDNWPDETNPESLENQNKMRDDFVAQHPDINIIPDTYKYDTKTFTMKASAGQLPTLYSTWFTEIEQIISQGYAADITDAMNQHGFTDAINPDLMKLVTTDDGKIYGVPTGAYAQGFYINKKLFREAGLVNEDGSVMVPSTYEEVAQFAQTIKEKTGVAGIVLPTTNNAGGWQLLNIAWSYGVDFLEQREDGTWEATFNTQAMIDTLQYYSDLKWKYNALMDESVITQDDLYKYFGTYQAAMMIADPPCSGLSQKYGMDIADIYVTRMPAGPAGRYSQMGGNLRMFSPTATAEQIDAGLTWLEFTGFSPNITDQQYENLKTSHANTISQNGIVLDQDAFPIWVNEENMAKNREARAEYTNVDQADYAEYYAFEDVTISPEPEKAAQQLYAILDGCIQEVITNQNADIPALVEEANNDYQVNHLDKLDE